MASATVRSGAVAGGCARGGAAVAGFGAVLRLHAGLRAVTGLPAAGRRAAAFGVAVRTLAGVDFAGSARRGALDFGRLGLAFAGFDFDAFLIDGLERARAACASLARFLACLAIFLLAFANFRARLSTSLAARSACFTAPARAAAFFASALNRCAAAACLADVADKGAVATTRSRWKNDRSLARRAHAVTLLQASLRYPCLRQYAEQEFANIGDLCRANRMRHRVVVPLHGISQRL